MPAGKSSTTEYGKGSGPNRYTKEGTHHDYVAFQRGGWVTPRIPTVLSDAPGSGLSKTPEKLKSPSREFVDALSDKSRRELENKYFPRRIEDAPKSKMDLRSEARAKAFEAEQERTRPEREAARAARKAKFGIGKSGGARVGRGGGGPKFGRTKQEMILDPTGLGGILE